MTLSSCHLVSTRQIDAYHRRPIVLATLTYVLSVVLQSEDLRDSLSSMAHEDWEVNFKDDLTTPRLSLVCPNPSHGFMSFSISTQSCV